MKTRKQKLKLENLFENAKKTSIEDIGKYGFLIAIILLHEISHFKIRNFHGENNLKDSPEKFEESGWFFENYIFGDYIMFHKRKNLVVENLLVSKKNQVSPPKLFKDYEKWFKEDFWQKLTKIEELKFNFNNCFSYKKIDKLDRDAIAFLLKEKSILLMKCGNIQENPEKLKRILFEKD